MRRDVRLLGDMLGEVISESDGPDLLADVERLRRAVIEARRVPDRASPAAAAAGDAIAALVASWPRHRAEQVARAFTVYFHLANLAEEQQRVRTLRERESGDMAPRESLADAVARITAEQGRGQWTSCFPGCGCTRFSPRTRPRRAAARWSSRCAGSAGCSPPSTRTGAGRAAAVGQRGKRCGGSCARRSTCCGGPPSSG